jgi:uncharacterized protein YjbJ (UPF0337 family)
MQGVERIANHLHPENPPTKESNMGLDDKIKNAVQDIAGKAKEALGEHRGDEDLRREGEADQTKANVKKAGENVKDAFK